MKELEEIIQELNLSSMRMKPVIKVIGLGCAGCNAVENMHQQGIEGVELIVCDTDLQSLKAAVSVEKKIQLGTDLTEGMGTGHSVELGRRAALEDCKKLEEAIGEDTNMLFIATNMGGGTGTGAAPVVAELARKKGILTIAVVTIPMNLDGDEVGEKSKKGVELLQEQADSVLLISSEKVYENFADLPETVASAKSGEVIATAVKGVAEIITIHGTVNVDFADVDTVMRNSDVFVMGSGEASGEGRAAKAIKNALGSPLLENADIIGAKYILLSLMSGNDEEGMTLIEYTSSMRYLQQKVGYNSNIITGYRENEAYNEGDKKGKVVATVVATQFRTDLGKPMLTPKAESQPLLKNEESEPMRVGEYVNEVSKEDKILKVDEPKERKSSVKGKEPRLAEKKDKQTNGKKGFQSFLKGFGIISEGESVDDENRK
ncbi:MAG: cell division protein FtsZ [Mangrovibacterium sp.]